MYESEYMNYICVKNNFTQNTDGSSNNPKQKHCHFLHGISMKYFLLLLWGHTALFFSPALYLVLVSKEHWWPFPAMIIIAILHFVSIFMIGIQIVMDEKEWVKISLPIHGGMYAGLLVCSSLFWIFAPPVLGMDAMEPIIGYYGFEHSESPSLFSFLLGVFCALICCFLLGSSFMISVIKPKEPFDENIKLLWKTPPYRNGFILTCLIFAVIGFILCTIPDINRRSFNHKIDKLNEKIDSLNHARSVIKEKRLHEIKNLSFADFRLGSSLNSCLSIVNQSYEYTISSKNKETRESPFQLIVNDIDYSSIIDTTLYIATEWDNQPITINLHYNNKVLMAISFYTTTKIDSLLSYYSSKYGEPEYTLPHIEYVSYHYRRIEQYIYLKQLEDDIRSYKTFDKYNWTYGEYNWSYSNSLIDIKGNNISQIIYLNKKSEKLLNIQKEEIRRVNLIKKKAHEDAIRRKNEIKKQIQDSELRIKKKNHLESIKKI